MHIYHGFFDCSERLYAVRCELLKGVDLNDDPDEQLHIFLPIKTVDVIRAMLLYEYELLDTSHVIYEELVPSYYARRVEILRMMKEQIGDHLKELDDLRSRISHRRVLDCIDQARSVIGSSSGLLNDTASFLEDVIISVRNGPDKALGRLR